MGVVIVHTGAKILQILKGRSGTDVSYWMDRSGSPDAPQLFIYPPWRQAYRTVHNSVQFWRGGKLIKKWTVKAFSRGSGKSYILEAFGDEIYAEAIESAKQAVAMDPIAA